jgi:DNA-directed RNA polymerase subunit M/transcription elongation factor TFIIS
MVADAVVCPKCQRVVASFHQQSGTDAPRIHFQKCPACGHEWSDKITPPDREKPPPQKPR